MTSSSGAGRDGEQGPTRGTGTVADVAVVIPARDAGRWLADALGSLLAQTVAAADILVVDDGSTDGTAAIAAAAGPPVRCVRQPPAGPAAARNRGVRETRAAIVGFLDADDEWPPASLAVRLAALAADPDVDAVIGSVEQFPDRSLPPAEAARVAREPYEAWVTGGLLIRRTALERLGGLPEARRGADFLEWLLVARRAGLRVAVVPEVVLRRRVHGASLSRREAGAVQADYLRIVRAELARRRAAGE